MKINTSEEITHIQKLVASMDGWFTDAEGEYLYRHALKAPSTGVFVEVGSWKGKSTIWLAHASRARAGVKVYAVDPHTGSPEHHEKFGEVYTFDIFKENIKSAGVEDMVVPLKKTSEEAAREWDGTPIAFLWIDGDHSYEMVKKDFEVWSPYLVEGGIVAFHDTDTWEGPRRFVEERIFRSNDFKDVGFYESTTVATKVRANTAGERMQNSLALLSKKVYQGLRHSKIPRPQWLRDGARAVVKKFSKV